MSIRAWRSLFVYLLFLLVLLLWLFLSPAGALADAGLSPGPRVVVVDGASGPDEETPAGTDAGDAVEGETEEAPVFSDPVEPGKGPGKTDDPGPDKGEEDPPVPSPEEEDGGGSESFPELETVSNSGAAVYRIPVAVPPGRNGMDPDLYLTYNSRRRNGPAGVGWNLDLGSIQRSTRRGVDYGARDYFFVSGGYLEELVPREGDWGSGYYGAKIEEDFVKYRHEASTGGWTAFGKDGTRYRYGSSASSRQSGSKGVFRWCLDAFEDSNGNRMTVSYLKDRGQVYPDVLSYPGGSGTVEVRCLWEGRPDVLVRHDAAFPVTTGKRLGGIAVYTGGRLVRKYVLEYETESPGGRCRLKRVRQYGSDGTTALPPVFFGYREGPRGVFEAAVREGVMRWDLSPDEEPEVRFLEADGDGRADILVTWEYWEEPPVLGEPSEKGPHERKRRGEIFRSAGDGTFEPYGSVTVFLSNPKEETIHLADVNGDGLTDLLLVSPGKNGGKPVKVMPYCSAGQGSYTGGTVWTLNSYRKDYMLDFADVNGDGYDDLIAFHWWTRQYFLYRSDGNGSFEGSPWKSGSFPVSTAEGGHNTWIDLNGDGLADCVAMVPYGGAGPGPTAMYVYLNDGAGGFLPAGGSRSFDKETARIVDMTGDGLPDIAVEDMMAVLPRRWSIYPGLGDGTFSSQAVVVTVPFWDEYVERDRPLIFGDVDGDGLMDVSLSRIGPEGDPVPPAISPENAVKEVPDPPKKLLMTTWKAKAAGPPGLLTSIEREHGGRVAIAYGSSSDCDNAFLPFFLPVVTAFSADDGLGNVSGTFFDYEGGYFDAGTREFRGFGTVTKTRPDGSVETTRYHNQDTYLKHKPFLWALVERAGGLVGGEHLDGKDPVRGGE